MEDDPSIRELFKIHLSTFGYRVLLAKDGEEALRLMTPHSGIQVLMTDISLPGLSGKDLADRALLALPQLEVLFCSGFSADDLAASGIDPAAANFLPKPCGAKELKSALQRVLASR